MVTPGAILVSAVVDVPGSTCRAVCGLYTFTVERNALWLSPLRPRDRDAVLVDHERSKYGL